jgi:CHAT domain-containing protein/Tfp pilus assembly protein PilF
MFGQITLNSNNLFIFSFLVICLLSSPSYNQTVETQQITTLESGKPTEREIAGGQKQIFQIKLADAQYAKATVEQRGVDVIVRLLDADGKSIVDFNTDPRIKGEETVELAVKTAGNYRLTIEPRQKNAPTGRYEIRVIELRDATAKDFALDEARKLLTESNNLWQADEYDKALPLVERALTILEREQGTQNPDYATALNALANIYEDKGEYDKAEPLYLRSLEIKEKALGKEHISLSSILNNLGTLYKDKGDYVKAETLFLRALEIREKWLEPNHLLIANVLNNLGNISSSKGDIVKAEVFYRRVLEIREKALGPETADVATTLNNIANLYSEPSKAEPLYLRALAIREKVLAPDNPNIAQTLYNLAELYALNGNYAKAEPMCRRALEIQEKSLGAEHPVTAYSINLLAAIYENTGDFAKSESLYQRAIKIREKTQGQYHPYLGGTLGNLAGLYALKGDVEKAISTQTRANSILEYNLALNLLAGSENEKLNYLKTIKNSESQTLTLNFQTAPNSKDAANMGATIVLQRKGRVLDAMSDSLSILRRRFNKQDQLLLDKLNDTTKQLVGLILDEKQSNSTDEKTKKIKDLESQKEELESGISRQSAGFYQKTTPVTLEAVQKAIPENATLIEFAVYQPVSLKGFEFTSDEIEKNAVGKPHYIVYVIRQNQITGKDLGAADDIGAAIDAYRQALRDPKREDVQNLARVLDEKIMSPVRALTGGSKQFLISPDGALNLIPFEALVDEKGQYLIENYSFTYLTSGRDLLRMQVARESKSKPLIIANPLFGAPIAEKSSKTETISKMSSRRNKRRSITATRNLSDTYFAPLGGTAQEARSIQEIFPEATVLTQIQATESALKQAVAPQILHIATHGFFLQDSEINKSNKSILESKTENPLFRSGLALAGANQRKNGDDDGMLTALEASGLNLWGTKLVVLSACDTGLGEVRNGEGVYGLRRAFVMAGAESLLMSLWSVSDSVTRELMTDYYKNLKKGIGRGASLRQVQLEMLKKKGREHPFYWAAFIQSGEWANLEGKS